MYLSEVAVAGFDPQYLLNLNQEAYTLAHCATAHSSLDCYLASYVVKFRERWLSGLKRATIDSVQEILGIESHHRN